MASCKFCADYIEWEQEDGRWFPVDEYGDRHRCISRGDRRPSREEEIEAAYTRGYVDGSKLVSRNRPTQAFDDGFILELVRLTHPDIHDASMSELANRVTARLLAMRSKK